MAFNWQSVLRASSGDWLRQLPERASLEMEEQRRSVGWAESPLPETAEA